MKSLLLAGLLILCGTQTVNAEEVPTEGWVKIGEIRHRLVTSQDGYINLRSIEREGTKFTYLHSWRKVDSNGAFIGDPNDWSNAKPGSGDCASNDKSDIRKKINEYACEDIAVTAEQLELAQDEAAYKIKVDPITDMKNIIIRWDNAEDDDATIIIRCRSGSLDAYIHTDTYNSDSKTIVIRWDKEAPITEKWTLSKSNDSFFAPNPMRFLEKIYAHEKLAFQWNPNRKVKKARSFELQPLRKYITKMGNEGSNCFL